MSCCVVAGRGLRAASRALVPVVVLMVAAVMALAVACLAVAAPARAAETPSSKAASTAAALYHNHCSVCHGEQGDGQSRARGSLNPPPRDFSTAQSLHELTRDRMIGAVTAGVPGTAMAGWQAQLDAKQIAAVVDFVRETFMRASTTADASRGRRLYAKSCSVCHGDRGAGSVWASANLKPAPRDFSAAAARSELTRERMLAAVAAGRPGTAMTGFATQLPPADIEAVVDYIRAAFMREGQDAGISGTQAHAGRAAAAVDMSLPMPQGLQGQVAAGQRFYAANCATCHGVKGDGQGPRAYFINPKPRNLISAESRSQFNRPALFAAVSAGKLGTEMPAWDKVLDAQQIADVSEYVFRAFGPAAAGRTPP